MAARFEDKGSLDRDAEEASGSLAKRLQELGIDSDRDSFPDIAKKLEGADAKAEVVQLLKNAREASAQAGLPKDSRRMDALLAALDFESDDPALGRVAEARAITMHNDEAAYEALFADDKGASLTPAMGLLVEKIAGSGDLSLLDLRGEAAVSGRILGNNGDSEVALRDYIGKRIFSGAKNEYSSLAKRYQAETNQDRRREMLAELGADRLIATILALPNNSVLKRNVGYHLMLLLITRIKEAKREMSEAEAIKDAPSTARYGDYHSPVNRNLAVKQERADRGRAMESKQTILNNLNAAVRRLGVLGIEIPLTDASVFEIREKVRRNYGGEPDSAMAA